jgi:hypothetical protein
VGKIEWSYDSTYPYAPEQVEFHSDVVHTDSAAALVFLLSVALLCIFKARSHNCEKWLLASSCACVCPSVRMQQFGFRWTDFCEISYLIIFRNSVEKIHVSFISDKNNNGYFTSRPT